MRATLQFDLSDPDDRHEFKLCTSASDMSSFISAVFDMFRQHEKYGAKQPDSSDLYSLAADYDLQLDQ